MRFHWKRAKFRYAVFMAAAIITAITLSIAGLGAKVVVTHADIGIPGVSKMYEAKLTNRGLLPVRIKQCDFVDDAMHHGTELAYAVQRWNQSRKLWETVVEVNESQFCKPYPLGIIRGRVIDRWLWPGQTLGTGEEATAGRDAFSIGDHARFVIFLKSAGDYRSSIATGDFIIDEHQTHNSGNLRVAH